MSTVTDLAADTATVRCEPSGREARVLCETPLMDAILQVHLPLGQSCDCVGLCGFCRVQVLGGADNLSEMADEEARVLTSLHAGPDERLACRAQVVGPVTVTTSYWGKARHSSDEPL